MIAKIKLNIQLNVINQLQNNNFVSIYFFIMKKKPKVKPKPKTKM